MKNSEFRILLIDDDEDDFVHLKDLLGEIPGTRYSITWKSAYEEGLQALRTRGFDVCLLDHYLGEQTGIELLQAAQQDDLLCPVIFLTGQGNFELDIQAMRMGASEYLVKNQLTAPLLERTIRYAMKHAFDVQQLRESKAQILQQDRLASLGLLASSLAHEIGTPLGVIRSRAEMAQRRITDDKARSDMDVIVAQIDRISNLVKSLLNLAREKKSDQGAAVNLTEALRDVFNLMQPEIRRHGINLVVDLDGDVMVNAESGPLAQVFLNLFVNSVHAIREAGSTRDHFIRVAVEAGEAEVTVVFEDSGCGIPAQNLPRLFQPFFTTKEIGQGTGLGLATSYRLMQSWGGTITAESEDGRGSRFTLTLQRAGR